MKCELKLEGLEPDNLLAFLSLLGLLRALERARPEWKARVRWDGQPLRPILILNSAVEQAEVLEAAAEGCAALAEVHSFSGRQNLNFPAAEARAEMKLEAEESAPNRRLRIDLLSSLISDAAVKEDQTTRATPYCALFGQGHQHFLDRLESVPKGTPPKELANSVSADDLNAPKKLGEALLQPWARKDRTQSFRWDPLEDRRYALRFEDPSTDKGMTVHGANRLASLALPLLTSVPVRSRGEMRLAALGTEWGPRGVLAIWWPIWRRPASLRTIQEMLGGCDGCPGLGIESIYKAERISVGKFFSFTRALPMPVGHREAGF